MRKLVFIIVLTTLSGKGFTQVEHIVHNPPLEFTSESLMLLQGEGCYGLGFDLDIDSNGVKDAEFVVLGTCVYTDVPATFVARIHANSVSPNTSMEVSFNGGEVLHYIDSSIGTTLHYEFDNLTIGKNSGQTVELTENYHSIGRLYSSDLGTGSGFEAFNSGNKYFGFRFDIDGELHYGWMRIKTGLTTISGAEHAYLRIFEYAYETIPDTPIIAGSTTSILPTGLTQSYNPFGILLNWDPYPNSVGCQVRGGEAGGTDPHNFIVQGNMPTQLFINGNGLTVGQNYQWKVRCAAGLNPPTGVSAWSPYDYFIYDP
ncbi:MAG: hypothetical protein HKN39_06205 [Flavobacteriales bacterium]|nr:hypothetical protein [Flavobacteriales bacterium]